MIDKNKLLTNKQYDKEQARERAKEKGDIIDRSIHRIKNLRKQNTNSIRGQ